MGRGGPLAEPVSTSRDRILSLLAEEPGLHLRELPRRLGISLRAVRYHLDSMRRDAVVTPHRRGRFERWFVAGSLSLEERTLISALRVSTERRILEALLRFGPSRFGALVDRLSLPPSSLARSLDRLRSDGLVALEGGRRYRLTDADALRMHLSGFRARFPDLLADAARDIFDETD